MNTHAKTKPVSACRFLPTGKQGEKNGNPYDGKLTKADGKGTWWEGYDPQELYAQNHPLSEGSEDINRIHSQWAWENVVALPTEEYCQNFFDRTVDMINKYNPASLTGQRGILVSS